MLCAVNLWDDERGKGKLDGPAGNRVKEHKFRGVLSEGIIYPAPDSALGDDLAEALGIVKYEPPLPSYTHGDPWNARGLTIPYHIDNIELHPYALTPQEPVVVTEKVHCTLCHLAMLQNDVGELTPVIASKGLAKQGLGIKNNETSVGNVYAQAFHRYRTNLNAIYDEIGEFCLFGEVCGSGIQNLGYRLPQGTKGSPPSTSTRAGSWTGKSSPTSAKSTAPHGSGPLPRDLHSAR